MSGRPWRLALCALLLCPSLLIQEAFSEPEEKQKALEAFQDAVFKDFLLLVEAARQHSDNLCGVIPKDPNRGFSAAKNSFRTAVYKYWPYPYEPTPLPEPDPTRPPGVVGPRPVPVSDAATALREAQQFEETEYRPGRADRKEALARYLEVADRFPKSPQRDMSLRRAALLYTQRAYRGAKKDYAAAEKLLRRLTSRSGSPTAVLLMAQENLAGFDRDIETRMRQRSEVSLNVVAAMSDPEWLKTNVLTPWEGISPKEYIKIVTGVLVNLRGIQWSNAKNVIADAALSPNPYRNLRWLKERHANDEFIQAEVDVALARLVERDFHETGGSFVESMVDEVVADTVVAIAQGEAQSVKSQIAGSRGEVSGSPVVTPAPPPYSKLLAIVICTICVLAGLFVAVVLHRVRSRKA